MTKDYYKSGKWFYPLQHETEKLLNDKYAEHSCNWQQITKDMLVECYVVIPKGQEYPGGAIGTVLLVYYKRNMTVTIFEDGDFFTSMAAIKNQEK